IDVDRVGVVDGLIGDRRIDPVGARPVSPPLYERIDRAGRADSEQLMARELSIRTTLRCLIDRADIVAEEIVCDTLSVCTYASDRVAGRRNLHKGSPRGVASECITHVPGKIAVGLLLRFLHIPRAAVAIQADIPGSVKCEEIAVTGDAGDGSEGIAGRRRRARYEGHAHPGQRRRELGRGVRSTGPEN